MINLSDTVKAWLFRHYHHKKKRYEITYTDRVKIMVICIDCNESKVIDTVLVEKE